MRSFANRTRCRLLSKHLWRPPNSARRKCSRNCSWSRPQVATTCNENGARRGAVSCECPRAGTEVVQQWRNQSPLCSLTRTLPAQLIVTSASRRSRGRKTHGSPSVLLHPDEGGLNERCRLSQLLWPGCAQGNSRGLREMDRESGENHKENRVFGTTTQELEKLAR